MRFRHFLEAEPNDVTMPGRRQQPAPPSAVNMSDLIRPGNNPPSNNSLSYGLPRLPQEPQTGNYSGNDLDTLHQLVARLHPYLSSEINNDSIKGTVDYMAPEQPSGGSSETDHITNITYWLSKNNPELYRLMEPVKQAFWRFLKEYAKMFHGYRENVELTYRLYINRFDDIISCVNQLKQCIDKFRRTNTYVNLVTSFNNFYTLFTKVAQTVRQNLVKIHGSATMWDPHQIHEPPQEGDMDLGAKPMDLFGTDKGKDYGPTDLREPATGSYHY